MKLRVKIIDNSVQTVIPSYATKRSSGMDISSASAEEITLEPMESKLIPTNLILEIPEGYEGQIRPRSGLAIKYNLGIMNSPGTIDSDYRGELKIILTNFGKEPYIVKQGDRIAQLIISKVEQAEIELSQTLSSTDRDSGGFGHTGVNSK